ncbi:hypothetical protein IAQ61_003048 [Plenodomus lingam]|uniref:uncharacterized protein n=1 Tax=Leptosphaeria maculans TaxID=5022 RepID=UPI00331EC7FA|nr:hypothetical protein IAQ61_003048 [Plenodomus lingam]
MDDVLGGIQELLHRTERLELQFGAGLEERFASMLARMENMHRQKMAEFQEQVNSEACRAYDRVVDETHQGIAQVVESATQAINSPRYSCPDLREVANDNIASQDTLSIQCPLQAQVLNQLLDTDIDQVNDAGLITDL